MLGVVLGSNGDTATLSGAPTTGNTFVLGLGTDPTGTGASAIGLQWSGNSVPGGSPNSFSASQTGAGSCLGLKACWDYDFQFQPSTNDSVHVITGVDFGINHLVLSGGATFQATAFVCPGSASAFDIGCANLQTFSLGPYFSSQSSALLTLSFNSALFSANDAVQIELSVFLPAGSAFSLNSFSTGFEQAIPEPSTFALLGAALAGVGFLRHRRKQA